MQTIALRRLAVALLVFLGIFATQTSFAIDGETTVVIPPGTESQFLPYGGNTLVSYEPPEHGTLIPVNNGFDYEPDDSFWAVGHDTMLIEVTNNSGITSTYRYILAAGSLSQDSSNTFYATTPTGPGDWTSTATIVPGTVAPNAYELEVVPGTSAKVYIHDNSGAGNQQTSEHVVNVTVDDLDLLLFPAVKSTDELPFYELLQNGDVILDLRMRFDTQKSVWQVRAYSDHPQATEMNYVTVTPGFYQVKLVRWGTLGAAGADVYVNNKKVATIDGLPLLSASAVTYQLTLPNSPVYDGLIMRFEDPTVTTGFAHADLTTPLTSDAFDADSSGIPAVSPDWDLVEGASYMSFSPQTLAVSGDQLDIDLGAIPHWDHAYMQQDFLADPLTNYKTRFWMDTSQVNIPEGQVMRLIYACRDSATDWCVDFRMFLTRTNGQLELGLDVWENGGILHTLYAPISSGPQVVELQYETSPSTAVATGRIEMWVDGVSVGDLDGLDNHLFTIEDVRFGSLHTSSQVTGTFSLDEILTWTR